MYTNLVFGGGGVKCISYIGILKYMEEHKEKFNIKKIAGSSGGSLFALTYSLGYNYNDLRNLIIKLDFNQIRDINTDNIFNFLGNYGLDTGNKMELLIKLIIKKKTNNENLTFSEFYKLYNIDLIISATCINTVETEFFSYTNSPNMPIYKAIRISCSIPFYYNNVEYHGKIYIDGGITNNYPINLFDNDLEHTIGFYPKNNNIIKQTNMNEIENYITNFVYCVLKKYEMPVEHKNRTIFIDCDFSFIDFGITTEKKEQAISNGYQSISQFFKNTEKE